VPWRDLDRAPHPGQKWTGLTAVRGSPSANQAPHIARQRTAKPMSQFLPSPHDANDAPKDPIWSTGLGRLLEPLAKRQKNKRKAYPLKLWADNPDDTPVNVTSVISKLPLASMLSVSLM
jgi:hypothetical protein